MDKEKIDHIFKEWQDKSMLTKKGALKVAHPWEGIVTIVLSSYILFACFAGVGINFFEDKTISFLYLILSLITLIIYIKPIQSAVMKVVWPMSFYYYKDRFEVCYFWGLWRKTYNYSDIKRVACDYLKHTVELTNHKLLVVKNEHEKEFFRTCFASLCVECADFVEYDGEIRHFANKICFKTKPECQEEVLQSAFSYFAERPKYFYFHQIHRYEDDLSFHVGVFRSSKRLFYQYMLSLFANMICFKTGDSYQDAGYQCLLKYLSDSPYREYCYVHDLSEQIERFRGYRAKKSVPSKDGFVNICLSILKLKGPDYADRLDLLTHLFECAYASDGMVDEEELNRLSRIAFYLRIKDWDFLSLRYRFETEKQSQKRQHDEENTRQRERYQFSYSSRKREAYNLLGLKTDATLEEVKGAYRTQVKTCHPDTLPPTATITEREEASQRFRTITEAYDFLCVELSAEPVSVAR